MSFPTEKPEKPIDQANELLRCHNVCECLLVDDLVYGPKLDSLVLTRREERFHALLKVEEATFKPKGIKGFERTPNFHVHYFLLRLDFEKTKRYMEDVIGMCDHTKANYDKIEADNIKTKIDITEWRNYDDETKLEYLYDLQRKGEQVFGYCDKCKTEWEANEKGLVPYLFERLVNKKLFIHPFIRSRHDKLDNIVVTEKMQMEYALYRLNEAFSHCVVGDSISLLNDLDACYIYDKPEFYEEGKILSAYGSLDHEVMNKVIARFKSYTLFDSADPIHAKRDSMDMDVSNVESTKVHGWFGGKDVHGFEVRYTKLRETKWTRTLALRNNVEEYKHLFALGFTTAEKANTWKMKINTEIPDKLEPKIEFEREFEEFSNAINDLAAATKDSQDGLDKEWAEVLYAPTGDPKLDDLVQWKVIKNTAYLDSETELMCLTDEEFPCSVNEVKHIVMEQRNYYLQVEELSKKHDEYDYVADLEKYSGHKAVVPTFERAMFSPTLVALDLNFGPPGADVKYGIVKQTALVSGRLRSDYEIGMPIFPYNMGWGLKLLGEETAMKVAHEGYKQKEKLKEKVDQLRGKKTEADHAARQYTYYDRWFALDKKFWTKDTSVGGVDRRSVRVMWKHTDVDAKNLFNEDRKTYSELAKTAKINAMFLRVNDTTPWDTKHKIPKPKLEKLTALKAIRDKFGGFQDFKVEARCLAIANIGHNTRYWDVRTQATEMLLSEFDLLFKNKSLEAEEELHMAAIIFAALDKVVTGLRSLVIDLKSLQWALWFYQTVERKTSAFASKDSQHPMKFLLQLWSTSWRSHIISTVEIEVPEACHKTERKEFNKLIGAFVELAKQHHVQYDPNGQDGAFMQPQSYIDFHEIERSLILVDDEHDNKDVMKMLDEFDPKKDSDWSQGGLRAILQAGFVLSQTPDHTAQVAFGFYVKDDEWTQMQYQKLTNDESTVNLVKRSLQCLRTPLAGAGQCFARWTTDDS